MLPILHCLIILFFLYFRKVLPSVEPGYLQQLLPDEAPQKPEPWQEILKDVDRIIMPGVTHWQSPNFHAYYPTACSYPSIVGDMLSGAIACVGFSWVNYSQSDNYFHTEWEIESRYYYWRVR